MNVFKLVGTIFIDSDAANESLSKTEKKAEGFTGKLKSGIGTALKWGGIVAGAAAAVGGAILSLDEQTKEYRENMAKLDTAYLSTGKSAEEAGKAYKELYKVLGDQDQATEAAQLLSNIAAGEEDIAKWSDIAAGVTGRFGDSLPIESLIEASNETIKVGKVTGALADALNWVGISEDDFNEKLAACTSEEERNRLVTETLSSTYQGAADTFRDSNAAIMEARDAQVQLDDAMAKLGGAVSEIKNKMMADFMPSISGAVSAFVDMIQGSKDAEAAFQENIQKMVDKAIEMLPQLIDVGIDIIVALGVGLIKALPEIIAKIPEIIGAIVEGLLKLGVALFEVGEEAIVSLWEGLKSKWEDVKSWVVDKVNWLIDKITFWDNNSISSGKEESKDRKPKPSGRHASGLAYVPYDGYKAELHKGETVLNNNDASELRQLLLQAANNQSNSQSETIPINLSINLDGKTLAQALFPYNRGEEDRRGLNLGGVVV